MHIVKYLRHVADSTSYSRKTTLVTGGHNPRTGEIWEPRKRKRAVNRRVRRFRNRNGYGFLVVNDSLQQIADICRIIGYYAEKSLATEVERTHGVVDPDFFGATPDHHARAGVALHRDFDSAATTKAQKLRHTKFDHAARDAVAAESLSFRENVAAFAEGRAFVNPLPPAATGVDAESEVVQTWVSFLADNTIPF